MNSNDKYKSCKKHGLVLFKYKSSKDREWWSCHLCLKSQWKKAQLKRRQKTEVREYQKDFNRKKTEIIKSLSLTLKILLIASLIKPE